MRNQNVIYDERIPRIKEQPKKMKSNLRFLLFLLLFFIFIICVLYFQSPLSKLNDIKVSKGTILSERDLLLQAQIEKGMSYYNFRTSTVQNMLEQMIEIEQVTVKRVFPNKLAIEFTEHPVVAFWLKDNELYPVLSTGHILFARPWNDGRVQHPILSGWPTKEGVIELSAEINKLPTSVQRHISEITLTPIMSDPYRLSLYMTDGYEVRTSIRKFAENMSWYPHIVEQAKEDGADEVIINLLDAKWYEDPTIQHTNTKDLDEKGE
jgi:cell division protein FtsQ